MPKAIIEIFNITKIYKYNKEPSLNNISISINSGEFFGLLGPNGAGKTTVISILCGLLKPTNGLIKVFDKNLFDNLSEIQKVISLVPQDIALYPTLNALENLNYFGRMYGIKGSILKDRIYSHLNMLGLEKHAKKQIQTYSGGMKRRINLIAGILHNPRILFLDEPTVGVDVQSRNIIIEYLKKINNDGITIIYTSHYMEEAENLCTSIAIIDYGKIIVQGKPKELINRCPNALNLENLFLNLIGRGLRD